MRSVETAKDTFIDLHWRDQNPDDGGEVAFAIVGGDRDTGDISVLLAMGKGARAPLHTHHDREGWPFRETITCLAGAMMGVDPHDPDFVLRAGMSIDLSDAEPHQPYVAEDGFALVIYRQPAGHKAIG